MKKINILRIILDSLMLISFFLLMDLDFLHIGMHERVGLLIGMFFVIHLVVNQRLVKVVLKKLFNKQLPLKIRIGYWIDIALCCTCLILMISGIGMSRTIFTGLHFGSTDTLEELHEIIANISLALMALHVLLHWKWVTNMGRNMIKVSQTAKGKASILAATVFILGFFVAIGVADANMSFKVEPQRMARGYREQISEKVDWQSLPAMTETQLAQYNGKNGQPAYIAVDGLVYDVSSYFIDGEHNGALAGTDQTGHITGRKCANALYNHCQVVATLGTSSGQARGNNDSAACTNCQQLNCDGVGCVLESNPTAITAQDQLPAMTVNQLGQYNGKDGQPSYVAVNGMIYDVSKYFINGEHNGAQAGTDLTGSVTRDRCASVLKNECPVVAVLSASTDGGPIKTDSPAVGSSTNLCPKGQQVNCIYNKDGVCRDDDEKRHDAIRKHENKKKKHHDEYEDD